MNTDWGTPFLNTMLNSQWQPWGSSPTPTMTFLLLVSNHDAQSRLEGHYLIFHLGMYQLLGQFEFNIFQITKPSLFLRVHECDCIFNFPSIYFFVTVSNCQVLKWSLPWQHCTLSHILPLFSPALYLCKLKQICFLTFPVLMKRHWPEALIWLLSLQMLPDLPSASNIFCSLFRAARLWGWWFLMRGYSMVENGEQVILDANDVHNFMVIILVTNSSLGWEK